MLFKQCKMVDKLINSRTGIIPTLFIDKDFYYFVYLLGFNVVPMGFI